MPLARDSRAAVTANFLDHSGFKKRHPFPLAASDNGFNDLFAPKTHSVLQHNNGRQSSLDDAESHRSASALSSGAAQDEEVDCGRQVIHDRPPPTPPILPHQSEIPWYLVYQPLVPFAASSARNTSGGLAGLKPSITETSLGRPGTPSRPLSSSKLPPKLGQITPLSIRDNMSRPDHSNSSSESSFAPSDSGSDGESSDGRNADDVFFERHFLYPEEIEEVDQDGSESAIAHVPIARANSRAFADVEDPSLFIDGIPAVSRRKRKAYLEQVLPDPSSGRRWIPVDVRQSTVSLHDETVRRKRKR